MCVRKIFGKHNKEKENVSPEKGMEPKNKKRKTVTRSKKKKLFLLKKKYKIIFNLL